MKEEKMKTSEEEKRKKKIRKTKEGRRIRETNTRVKRKILKREGE